MEIQGQEIYYQENNNPNYGYINQHMGFENMIYHGQIMKYNQQEGNIPNIQYSQQYNQVKLPPTYDNQIETVNETHGNQIKYLNPIELSEGLDINNYLQSWQLNQQISPGIMELKQETQHNNNPFAYTEVASKNDKLNVTSYMNSNYSLDNQINYNISKSQLVNPSSQNNNYGYNQLLQNNINRNQEVTNSIEYSSALPVKIEQTKFVNNDQYENGLEEDQNEVEEIKEEQNEEEQKEEIDNDGIQNGGDNPMDNDELPNTDEHESSETENQLELKQLQLQQQQLLEQKKLQLLEQQKSQLLIQKQKIEQEILQQQYEDDPKIISPNNNTQKISPYLYENSKNRINIRKIQSFPLSNQILQNPCMDQIKDNNDFLRKGPRIQKAIKIFGNLRPRQRIVTSYDQYMAAIKIQNKWRNHFLKKRFELIKPKLIHECENFLRVQYELCDRMGQIPSDDDFSLEGWKKFYPQNNSFFNFDKGFVIPYGVKIEYPNDPIRVSIYEGDVNINNEKHGFGRLTTTKGVFLGEWRNDQFTGWGRETRRNGKVFEGKYINWYIEGKGILRNNKGNSYIGDFSNSKRHGIGVLDTHKIHYEGEFKNDKLNGKGKIIFKNEGHYYEGDFENNEINGYGTFKWKNGDCYTGQMLNGKMNGLGRYRYNTGQVFEGTYANGIRQGGGKIYSINNNEC